MLHLFQHVPAIKHATKSEPLLIKMPIIAHWYSRFFLKRQDRRFGRMRQVPRYGRFWFTGAHRAHRIRRLRRAASKRCPG